MSEHLNRIDSPSDIKKMPVSTLRELAEEVREYIIATTSTNGGHLAPNLGVVELTIALHRVLNSPKDKIIWDVGHQCYTHKLLTGRREDFPSLRQHGGLSGFTSRAESEHDAFGAGHGSTSISAALGFATARDLQGGDERVVAVIGDGALTGGLALEALNQAGEQQRDLLVVLNDNKMSISANVGAMSGYLAKLRASVHPASQRARRDAMRILRRMPLGDTMLGAMDRIKESVKQLVVPGMLFEHLGFTYMGPIDGHDLPQLIEVLEHALRLRGPVLLHVLTEKGRGYKPAEANPAKFHGIRPFDVNNGEINDTEERPTYSRVFAQALCELAEKDERIVVISAAMLPGTKLNTFKEQFPDRCFDVGMTEGHAVTYAAGLAAAGLRPVVAIYSTFLQRAYDQILHDVALQDLPVVFGVDRAGFVGDDGPTHHGVFDLSYLRQIPNMTLMAPSNEAELRRMLATALSLDGPAAIRYPRGGGPRGSLDESLEPLTVGKAEVLRDGEDLAILAVGTRVEAAMQAAECLAEKGIDCEVVNVRFVKPVDEQLITHLAGQIGRIVTVEENALAGGFGAAVAEVLSDSGLTNVNIVRLGVPDEFMPHGSLVKLWDECAIDADAIVRAGVRLCSPQNSPTVK